MHDNSWKAFNPKEANKDEVERASKIAEKSISEGHYQKALRMPNKVMSLVGTWANMSRKPRRPDSSPGAHSPH